MSHLTELPPPKRYLVETDTDEDGNEICTLVDATGEKELVYIKGVDSPWLGKTLDDIEKWAREGAYGRESGAVITQVRLERMKSCQKN